MRSYCKGLKHEKKTFCFGHVLRPLTMYAILFLSCYSVVSLFGAMVSQNWLITKEKISLSNGSATYLETFSGLWTKCSYVKMRGERRNCSNINYFVKTEKDGLGPTDSILLSLRKATIFPVMCFLILMFGQAACIFATLTYYRPSQKLRIFIAIGTLHIVAGLFLFIGLIIYIGAITDEAMDRSKVEPAEEHPPFLFNYGASLTLVVSTFFSGELTGVLSIQFYFSSKRFRNKSNHGDSDEVEVQLSNREISNTEILKIDIPDVRFHSVAKQPTVTCDELTSNTRLENPTRRDLTSVDQKEHKPAALGGCINKLEVRNKNPKKVDRVSERLSSSMFDANMSQNILNTSERLTDPVNRIGREKLLYSKYFNDGTSENNHPLTERNQRTPVTDDNICSAPFQERFLCEFTRDTMKSRSADHKFPSDGCSFNKEKHSSVVVSDKIFNKNMADRFVGFRAIPALPTPFGSTTKRVDIRSFEQITFDGFSNARNALVNAPRTVSNIDKFFTNWSQPPNSVFVPPICKRHFPQEDIQNKKTSV